MSKSSKNAPCPCGSNKPLTACCQPILDGATLAATAEQLMRSRYTAYAVRHDAWLRASWHPSTRPAADTVLADPAIKWISLHVHDHHAEADKATVRFTATCKISGRLSRMSENSRFVRENGHWFYVDGIVADEN